MNKKDFKNSIFSLSERIYPMVVRLLGNDIDAKDAIQEIMIKLWNKRNQLTNHPNQSGYVFLTARNHCLDILKRKKVNLIDPNTHDPKLMSINGHTEYELKELISIIEKILCNRPTEHKEILLMRDLDGMGYDEIAEVTKINVKHLRVIISRTRKFVQEELRKNFNYEQ